MKQNWESTYAGASLSSRPKRPCLIFRFSTMASNTRSVFWIADASSVEVVTLLKTFWMNSSPAWNKLDTLQTAHDMDLFVYSVSWSTESHLWLISKLLLDHSFKAAFNSLDRLLQDVFRCVHQRHRVASWCSNLPGQKCFLCLQQIIVAVFAAWLSCLNQSCVFKLHTKH